MNRVFHPDSRVETDGFGGDEGFVCEDAEVWIEGESILVCYFDDEGVVVLEGRTTAAGGYELKARSRPWWATLEPDATSERRYEGTIGERDEQVRFTLVLGAPIPEESD